MIKVLAVLRTVVLLFVVAYALRAVPLFTSFSNTLDEQYARCSAALHLIRNACWIAVGWIALETVVGWLMVRAARRKPPAVAAPPPPASSTP